MFDLKFRPGCVPEETVLEIITAPVVLEKALRKLTDWIDRTYDEMTRGGLYSCPALGEYHEAGAWAMLPEGPVEIDLDDGAIKFIFFNQPEGEDALDPSHPDWTRARDTLWIEALPRVSEFLALEVL